MKEESRIEALEHELKILKNEIQATLLEIREQILNHYYPELRAEEPMRSHSLPVRQQVGRPGLPAKAAPMRQETPSPLAEIEAKGQIQPFSDIFLEDLEEEAEEEPSSLVNSRRPTTVSLDALEIDDDEYGDDDNDDDELDVPAAAERVKVTNIVGSPNKFAAAPQTREVDFRQLKGAANAGAAAAKASPSPVRAESLSVAAPAPTAKVSRQNFAALATWVSDGVSKVGKERTIQIVETYANGGKLSAETRSSLLQLISLASEDEPDVPAGTQAMLGLMVGLDQILS
jgi:hypothetical protein